MVDPVHAIESGDLFAVASFLGAADGNRYWVDRSGRTALWWAARCDQVVVATLILSVMDPTDRHRSDYRRRTALHVGTVHGSAPTIALLLAAGLRGDVADIDGNTVLHAALLGQRDSHIASMVLSAAGGRPCLFVRNKAEQLPIEIAALYNRLDLVRLMVDRYASPVPASAGVLALRHGHLPLIRYLVREAIGVRYPVALLLDTELDQIKVPGDIRPAVRRAIQHGLAQRRARRDDLHAFLAGSWPRVPVAIITRITEFVLG